MEDLTASNLHIEVFPNPSNGDLVIRFNLLNPHNVKLELIDLLGKQILSTNRNYKSGQHKLYLKSLIKNIKPGLYFLNCLIGNYMETQQVFIY